MVKPVALAIHDANTAVWAKLKEIAKRERRPVNAILNDLIVEYVKTHGDGNPNFEITKWVDNEDFKVIPSLWNTVANWDKYLNKCNGKELEDIESRLLLLKDKAVTYWRQKKYPHA